jgi:hypothetical protein
MPVTAVDIEREIARREIDEQLDQWFALERPTFRGAVAELMQLLDDDCETRPRELMISGPAETGKTFGALYFLDAFMRKFAGAQGVIGRKVLATMNGSVLQTWRRVIALRGGVRVYGGEKPEWYDYANGSRVWVAGLDNPGKALSSERDIIYINQAEELQLDDWQTLKTRTTGRGAVAPWTLLYGDCNPGAPTHWIMHRPALVVKESRHVDNPSLYTETGELTPQGVLSMSDLDSLEGVLKERYRYGRWRVAEGAVYNFDRRLHIVAEMPAGWEDWRKVRGIDFGYNNPFVCLWAAIDPDGRIYIYRQLYMTERTVDQHAEQIKRCERWYKTFDDFELLDDATRAQYMLDEQGYWMLDRRSRQPVANPDRERITSTVADHDAEDRATLLNQKIVSIPAKKAISVGVQAMQKRLRKAGDGRPRFFVLENCLVERDERLALKHQPTSIEQEFDVYVWPKGADGKPQKETPVDLYNHAMDAARYVVLHVERSSVSLIR